MEKSVCMCRTRLQNRDCGWAHSVAEDSVDETNLYYSNKAWINLAAFNVIKEIISFAKSMENSILFFRPSLCISCHPCIPPTTPVLYHELCQWIIIGLIHWKSQKKAVKSNLGKFLRKCNFNFFNAKNWHIFASFEPSFCSSSIFLTFVIELRFPNDSQILVDDFRHQNFEIWTFLGEVMAIFI